MTMKDTYRTQAAYSKRYEQLRETPKRVLSAYLKRHDTTYKNALAQYRELTEKEPPIRAFTQMAEENIRTHLSQVSPLDLKCVYFPEVLFEYRIQRTQLANNELEGLVRHVNEWFKPGVDLSITFFRGPFEIPEAGLINAKALNRQSGIPSALQNDLEILRSSYDTILSHIWWQAVANVLTKDSHPPLSQLERIREVIIRVKSFQL